MRWPLTAVLLLGLSAAAYAQPLPKVAQQLYSPPQMRSAAPVDALRIAPLHGSLAPALRLPPLSDAERDWLAGGDARRSMRIGVNRDPVAIGGTGVDASSLVWDVTAPAGPTGMLALTSAGAAALRSQLSVERLPLGTRVDFHSGDGLGASDATLNLVDLERHAGSLWSPTTQGDTQVIRVVLPHGSAPEEVALRVLAVSHLTEAAPAAAQPRLANHVGLAAACNIDVNCVDSAVVQRIADAVVKMVFTGAEGTYLCTGNLINDAGGTFTPYLLTAAHCIDSQALASTLQTYWFFESSACNSGVAANYVVRSGGAALLYADEAGDVALLRLNQTPPGGALFSGWDANPLSLWAELGTVHHPRGDLKMVAAGEFIGFGEPGNPNGDLFNAVKWSYGITEPGSSGAGLFTVDGDDVYLRGGLWGGNTSCDHGLGVDLYSRFDLAYPQLRTWLSPAPTFQPHSGWWWNPDESGRGFGIEIRDGRLFLASYLYAPTGRATWLSSAGSMLSTTRYSGDLVAYAGGQTLSGAYKVPSLTGVVGEITLEFTAADRATLNWPGGSMALQRFEFASGAGHATVAPEAGWWWNPAESGRGFFLETQGDVLFLAGYMYDAAGNPIWYSSTGNLDVSGRFSATWTQYADGQTLSGGYKAPRVANADLGAVVLQFESPARAELTLPDGRKLTLVRFTF